MEKKLVLIYNIIATLAIVAMAIYIASLQRELTETEQVLTQCEKAFYSIGNKSHDR